MEGPLSLVTLRAGWNLRDETSPPADATTKRIVAAPEPKADDDWHATGHRSDPTGDSPQQPGIDDPRPQRRGRHGNKREHCSATHVAELAGKADGSPEHAT
jgi:hypothetical protein